MALDKRSDEQIQKDVLAELRWEPRLQPNEIGVAVKDGVVTLFGLVDSYIKRWAAEDAALRVKSVKALANEIEVKLPSSAERTDVDIAADAMQALELDAGVPTDRVDVTVSKGWVTLRGEIEWQYQREEAERVVCRIAGVRGVTNVITVTPLVTSKELKQKVQEALVRSAETDTKRVEVLAEGSKVILNGKVRSWAERREAERATWSAPGITAVENHIIVDP